MKSFSGKHTIYIVIVSIGVKFLYVIFGLGCIAHLSDSSPEFSTKGILELFHRNDSYWYAMIAENGHQRITPDQLGDCNESTLNQSYYEFLPLYPFTLRAIMEATGLDFLTVAFLFSFFVSILTFYLFFLFAWQYTQNKEVAFLSTMVLILFPFHYYFSMYYSESLYLALLLGSFLSIKNSRFLLLAILLPLLVLVRPNGVFMLIPLFIYFFEIHYALNINVMFDKPITRLVQITKKPLKEYLPLLAFISGPLALICYGVYLYYMTGDFFAYITARRGWCLYSTFPWEPILKMSNWGDYFRFVYLSVFLLLSVILIKKIPLSFQALIWINIFLPLTSNLITLPRFISSIFIFSLIFGIFFSKVKKPYLLLIFVALFLLQLFTFAFWINGSEFSF
jgi:Gpi18-like mannosyltransferase